MSRRTLRRAALAAAAVLAGWAVVHALRGPAESARTAKATREDLVVTVEATGTLEAAVAYEIGPPALKDTWSYDLTWMIPEGRKVAKGDVLARFDTTELDERLRDYRADLETTLQERQKEQRNLQASLERLELDLVKARGELKQVTLETSVPEELVSSIEVQQTRLQKALAERRVEFLSEKIEFEKSLVRSKLELLDVKRKFNEGKIRYNEEMKAGFDVKAPISGVVVYVPKRNGERWEVGESVWLLAKILKVADLSTLRVEANVLEVDAAKVEPGQRVSITVDAVPGLVLESEVAEIGKIVRERSVLDRGKVFDAVVPLKKFDPELLRPGMGVKVRIETDRLRDVLTVPLAAIEAGADAPFVRVRRDGRFVPQTVVLGQRNAEKVVVEQGLEPDDTVQLVRG